MSNLYTHQYETIVKILFSDPEFWFLLCIQWQLQHKNHLIIDQHINSLC